MQEEEEDGQTQLTRLAAGADQVAEMMMRACGVCVTRIHRHHAWAEQMLRIGQRAAGTVSQGSMRAEAEAAAHRIKEEVPFIPTHPRMVNCTFEKQET